jgi:3-phenylpropionate/cinnamic acid dioxygenase small subunit
MTLLAELEQLFYLEADLLDERRYEEWLELLADDFQWSMPLRMNVKFDEVPWRENTRAGSETLWVDENKKTVTQRVQQILTGEHWAEEPFSRVSHLVTNIRLKEADSSSAALSARFLVYRNRMEAETDILAGRRLDWLTRVGDEWRFSRREVLVDQNVLLAKNLTFFI